MKSERLFEMLLYLIEKKSVTASELSEHFHVSARTIYRDIDALSGAGIPVYTTTGNQGGIHLMDHYVLNKTLLTTEEQENILLALHAIQTLPFFSSGSVIAKIAPMLQQSDQWLKIDFAHWGDGGYPGNTLFLVIKESILSGKRILIEYANVKGEYAKRVIEPLKLVFQQSEWYLYAFCQLRQDFRFFKIKRISSVQKLNENCAHHYQDYPNQEVAMTSPTLLCPIDFVGIIPKSVAYRVFDMLPIAEIEHISESEIRATATLNDDEWLYSFLLSFGSNVKIVSPPELAKKSRGCI